MWSTLQRLAGHDYLGVLGPSIDVGCLPVGVKYTSTHYTMAIVGSRRSRLASDELEWTCMANHYIGWLTIPVDYLAKKVVLNRCHCLFGH